MVIIMWIMVSWFFFKSYSFITLLAKCLKLLGNRKIAKWFYRCVSSKHYSLRDSYKKKSKVSAICTLCIIRSKVYIFVYNLLYFNGSCSLTITQRKAILPNRKWIFRGWYNKNLTWKVCILCRGCFVDQI